MKKRRSFDELMNAIKTGRSLSPESVARTVERFLDTPIGALYPVKDRKEWLPDLLKLDRTYDRRTKYIHFLMRELSKFGKESLHHLELLFNLAAIGYLDPVSRRRSVDRMPDTFGKQAAEGAKDPGETKISPLRTVSRELYGEMNLDELYKKNVLPFLRLTIRDYMEYLADYDPKFPLLYERCFARDVELWEKENETTPTIGDVLAQVVQGLSCFADVRESVGDEEMENCPLWEEIPERAFQRKNIQGTYWPPEDEEGILDAEWVWILVCAGPLMVYKAKLG